MRDGWNELKLGSFAKVISGFAFKSKDLQDDAEIPVIKIGNIKHEYVDLNITNSQFVHDLFLKKLNKKYVISKGDLLISLTGSHLNQPNSVVGRVALYRHDQIALLNQRAGKVIIKNKNQIDKLFLFYLLSTNSMRVEIALRAFGAANQANVSPSDIENIKLTLPPLPLQTRIADLLSAYDELIELNNRRIALLEQTAEQLYKEWFVRLRFPGYEQTKVRKGVQEGWSVKRLSDVCHIMSGGTPSKKVSQYWDGSIPFFTPKDVPASIFCFSTDQYITEVGLENCNSKLYPEHTIMLTARGTVGKVAMLGKPMAMNQSCFALKGKEISPFYAFLLIKHQMKVFKAMANGATFDTIILKTFDMIKVNHPTAELIKYFHQRVKPIFNQIQTLQTQNQALRRTRDLLLPRLISGQLSVAEAETALNA